MFSDFRQLYIFPIFICRFIYIVLIYVFTNFFLFFQKKVETVHFFRVGPTCSDMCIVRSSQTRLE